MRKYLPQLLLVVFVVVAWAGGLSAAKSEATNTQQIEARIAEAEELGTYKSALKLYDRMIAEYPDDISWRVRKAEAYQKMGSNNNYIESCQSIVRAFPDDTTGYLMLIESYVEAERVEELIRLIDGAPEEVRTDEEVAGIYKDYEYYFKIVSSPYEEISPFMDGSAVVALAGYAGYIDETGSPFIECDFDEARPFLESLAAVKKDDEWFLVDEDGDRVAATHDAVEDLYSPSEGYTLACVDGVYGYYDEELRNPIHFEYEAATSFYNDVAAVKQNGKWALVDQSFEPITGFDFDDVAVDHTQVCARDDYFFAKRDGAWHLYDLEGTQVGQESFDDACAFVDDLAAVAKGGKWGYVNTEGEIAIEPQFEAATSFNKGIGGVEVDGSWGYVNRQGELVVSPQFDVALPVSDKGIAPVSIRGDMRCIRFSKLAA